MFGAIIGDIVGSRFEFDNCKSKEFELFTNTCDYTDDTVMTLAVAKALLLYGTITDMDAFTRKAQILSANVWHDLCFLQSIRYSAAAPPPRLP